VKKNIDLELATIAQRRSFLRIAAGAGAATLGAGLLAACGGGGGGGDEATSSMREDAQTRIINGCESKGAVVVDTAGTPVGYIDFINDGVNASVFIYSADNANCKLRNIKLWLGTDLATLPRDSAGMPDYAAFPVQQVVSGDVVAREALIPLASLGLTSAALSCAATPPKVYVVGQVTTGCTTGTVRGYDSPNSTASFNFARFDLCCADTLPPVVLAGCETAFAKGGYVFTTDARSNPEGLPTLGLTRNRWGWGINLVAPGVTTYRIYAGAGLNQASAGKLVGLLTVDYTGSQASVTYTMAPGAVMTEAHLYVGDRRPTTIAPGQFGNTQSFATPATTHSVTVPVSDSNGDGVWLIAHAVVCGSN
jgi:hypothetical protein